MIPVILSGGSGTRLWPISRTKLPKQFCQIFDDSLQNLTMQRLMSWNKPWVITNKNLQNLTMLGMQKFNIPTHQILLEPTARNTAPAIALITHVLNQKGMSDDVVGVFPADHLIEKVDLFEKAINLAVEEAHKGYIVTLGIQPDFAATGFGYIHTSDSIRSKSSDFNSFAVKSFHEKPELKKAEEFIRSGNYFWNAGIFLFKIKDMVAAFEKHQPAMWSVVQKIKTDLSNLEELFPKLENISIDYAIMEKLGEQNLSCIPCEIGWSDVGSWDAVSEVMSTQKQDSKIEVDAKNNFVYSQQNKKYALVDVHDLIIVDTADATLIAKQGSTQKVKDVVDKLKNIDPNLTQEHVYEERPWGRYEILRDTDLFKSKVIHVSPHQQLSYQSHNKREEHWIITKGVGEVVLNDKIIPVKAGTYVNIPLGAKHRMRNTGNEVLEFVEVQIGNYFGEDDIIRYQDDYKRA